MNTFLYEAIDQFGKKHKGSIRLNNEDIVCKYYSDYPCRYNRDCEKHEIMHLNNYLKFTGKELIKCEILKKNRRIKCEKLIG